MPVGHRMFTGVSGTRAPANSELVREAKSGTECERPLSLIYLYCLVLSCTVALFVTVQSGTTSGTMLNLQSKGPNHALRNDV